MAAVVNNENNKWWQLFMTGTHTSADGSEFHADENTIDTIITKTRSRNYANDEIPICIGHKKDDSPKWGAFNKNGFKRSGAFLLGRYEYLVKEFAEAVSRRMFDKISIALYPDLSIKHIALLGVQAPAVKGLELITLSSAEGTAVEIESPCFKEYPGETEFKSFRKILRFFSGLAEKYQSNHNTLRNNMKTAEELEQENKELSLALSEKEKELEEAKQKELETEIRLFCESEKVKNKIPPAFKFHIEKIYALLKKESQYEFAEGDITKTAAPAESFRHIIETLPDIVDFSEKAAKENAAAGEPDIDVSEFSEMNINEESLELHRKALKIQQSEKCSYKDAVAKAVRT